MKFISTAVAGAYLVDLDRLEDERGYFARTFCAREFLAQGLPATFVQCSVSHSRRRGTLRGMHYQRPPAGEAKLVRCVAGAIHDVIVDLRPESPTRGRHVAVELTARNHRALFVPEYVAHGFQTLADETEVFYQMTTFHTPACATGCRHDDPVLGLSWPLPVTEISERDRSWPLLGAPLVPAP